MIPIIYSDARLSNSGVHRYSLTRTWDSAKPKIMFIGLNPSRADHVKNDATIVRCITYGQDWELYGGIFFANLYSFRTPYVKALPKENPEGWTLLLDNLRIANNQFTDEYLKDMIDNSSKVVCCWGSWPFTRDRENEVLAMIKEPVCFGINLDGSPKHPLYLPKTAELVPYPKLPIEN